MRRKRYAALLGATVFVLAGCEAKVFDHSPVVTPDGDGDGDGDGGEGPACAVASEGDACDDRDICTPSSVCRSGACFGKNPFDTCVVADAVADFSGVQGQKGWSYGYWVAATDADGSYDPDTDFEPMEFCAGVGWTPPNDCGPGEWTENLGDGLQHAETNPRLRLPVRRWTSGVSGPAHIAAEHYIGGGNGDGTRALLLLDGVEIWSDDALPGAPHGTANLAATLEAGTRVELLLHPKESQAEDTSYFSITIGP